MPILLKNGIYAILVCAILVVISYYIIDKPVAFWIYAHKPPVDVDHLLSWFTDVSAFLSLFVIFLYVIFIVRFVYHKATHLDYVLLAVANSVVIATYLKDLLKIVFGRYWPETWENNNPSLIKNHAYGFHFFHDGAAYGSFPSGHTTVAFAGLIVLWMTYPKFRWIYAVLLIAVITGLIGLNYHFVSDVIAGAFLGTLTAYYVVNISGLNIVVTNEFSGTVVIPRESAGSRN